VNRRSLASSQRRKGIVPKPRIHPPIAPWCLTWQRVFVNPPQAAKTVTG